MLLKTPVGFLMPVPANTKLFERLDSKYQRLGERHVCAFQLNNRLLFGTKKRADRLYAYIILDPEKRTRELKKLYNLWFYSQPKICQLEKHSRSITRVTLQRNVSATSYPT